MISDTILQTLKYSDHFGFPLTLKEIHVRLIHFPISQIRLISQIRPMLKAKSISQTGIYYHLPGHSSLVARRLARAKISVLQLSRARSLARLLSSFPTILAIFLTGSLAMSNSDVGSDIDFMIITKNHRLWTTRLLLTLYTELLGLRRRPHSTKNSGKLCLNLYLTPASYQLPSTKRSLYTAYELIQAVPLYDPSNTRTSLLSANPWIQDFLPNAPQRTVPSPRSDLVGHPTRSDLAGFIEKLVYRLQLWYMHPKLTREYVTPNSAFFHPHNPGEKVLKLINGEM